MNNNNQITENEEDNQATKGNCQKKDDAECPPRLSSSPIGPKPVQKEISAGSTSQSPKESTPVRVKVSSPQKQRRKTKKVPEATVQPPSKVSDQNVDDDSGSNVS